MLTRFTDAYFICGTRGRWVNWLIWFIDNVSRKSLLISNSIFVVFHLAYKLKWVYYTKIGCVYSWYIYICVCIYTYIYMYVYIYIYACFIWVLLQDFSVFFGSPIVYCSMINSLIPGCLWPLVFVLNSFLILGIWCSAISHLPGCFCPRTFFQNIGFNMARCHRTPLCHI